MTLQETAQILGDIILRGMDAIVERQKAVAAAYVPTSPSPVVQPRRKKARPKT